MDCRLRIKFLHYTGVDVDIFLKKVFIGVGLVFCAFGYFVVSVFHHLPIVVEYVELRITFAGYRLQVEFLYLQMFWISFDS